MTKEITKANILQEIQDKFKLRELIPETFAFSELVVPVYNVGPHLQKRVVSYCEVSITSAAGFLFYQVPENEQWVLNRYNIIFMAAGAYKVSGLYIRRYPSVDAMYLDLTEGQIKSYAVDITKPVLLDSKDSIWILVDDYTSTADLRLYIDYVKETLR